MKVKITNEIFEKYLSKRVKVKVDRPIGSKHLKFDMVYLLSYGYLPKTKAIDGEKIDAYVLETSRLKSLKTRLLPLFIV